MLFIIAMGSLAIVSFPLAMAHEDLMPPVDRLADNTEPNELIDRSPVAYRDPLTLAENYEEMVPPPATNPDVSESEGAEASLMDTSATSTAEDEFYCPQDFCRRLRQQSLLIQLSNSQASEDLSVHECVRVTASTLRGRSSETRQAKAWGESDGPEVKSKLVQDGYHMTECHVATAKKDL